MDRVVLADLHAAPAWQYVALPFSALIFLGLIGNAVYQVVNAARPRKEPAFDGPALPGTAQVLSAQGGLYFGGRAVLCRMGLRVGIPGRPPYDVTVKKRLDMDAFSAMQPGATVAVEVDSANPEKVRIVSPQPMPPPQAGWPGSAPTPVAGSTSGTLSPGVRMYIRVLWGLMAFGFVAAIIVLVVMTTMH
jgi:hypothetical protein